MTEMKWLDTEKAWHGEKQELNTQYTVAIGGFCLKPGSGWLVFFETSKATSSTNFPGKLQNT